MEVMYPLIAMICLDCISLAVFRHHVSHVAIDSYGM